MNKFQDEAFSTMTGTAALDRAAASTAACKPRMSSSIRPASLMPRVQARSAARLVSAAAEDSKPTILVAEKLGQAGLDMLAAYGNVDTSYDMSPSDLQAKISLCDAVVIRSATKVTADVIKAAKGRLKVVGRAGVGIDNVDLAAATENGVMVVNAPNANTVAAAEHGIALLCALARNVAQADASMKNGGWERGKYVGVSLVGKTIAVMGFGKVCALALLAIQRSCPACKQAKPSCEANSLATRYVLKIPRLCMFP